MIAARNALIGGAVTFVIVYFGLLVFA